MRYITTPIYYVNAAPHVGHAVTTLAADVVARFWRLKGDDTFFLTGTDEHGAKIAQAAEKSGQEPHIFVDTIAAQFEQAWADLNITPDGFIRTTDPKHEAFVQHFLQQLYDTGYIYKGEYKGWYCVGCEEFKTETQIGANNTCPTHQTTLTELAEETYLFKLTPYRDALLRAIESDTLAIRPASRKNEVLSFIRVEGLRDTAISRHNVAWGIPVPWDKSHTIYVWFDALLNYLSAADPNGPDFNRQRPVWPPTLQLIGKDILRFHAVIWPALLLAANQELPKELFVHGYFTINGQKMSKSVGNVIKPSELIARYGVDGARYGLLAAVPFGADGDISHQRLDRLYTSDLANNLGNLINRTQALLAKYADGVVPTGFESQSVASILEPRLGYDKNFAALNLSAVIEQINSFSTNLNRSIEAEAPWQLAKTEPKKLNQVLAELAESVLALGVIVAPILPSASRQILGLFNTSIDQIDYDTLGRKPQAAGKKITPIAPLFPRLAG